QEGDGLVVGRRAGDRARSQEGLAEAVRFTRPPVSGLRGGDRRDAWRGAGDRPVRARAAPRLSPGAWGAGERWMEHPPDREPESKGKVRSIRRHPQGPGFTIITGLSGAGRSEA